MQTRRLAASGAVVAPDGSRIRELVTVARGSMVHCTLPKGAASSAVVHATVDEAWYFLAGAGQVWRNQDGAESVVDVEAGVALTIECGTHFQFRNTGDEDLHFVIATMPPWPGAQEARRVRNHWPVPRAGAASDV
ncbi:MAG: cupin domain-containing protein [Acidobacteria bacterium]|nr:cupin domain-containing protein [Acidobacteriota bacterium]